MSVTGALSFTSCCSEAAVEFYEERIKPGIDTVRRRPISLQELVAAAETIINERFAHDPQSTFACKKGNSEEISVELDQIMLSMLANVEECGGESGKRYVASAIVACSKEEDVVGALAALGTTWLTHFLFVFKTGRTRSKRWKKSICDDLMIRDGYTCIVTGAQDSSHPEPTSGVFTADLVCAHILCRPFDPGPESKFVNSALTTYDILVNFTCLPVKTPEELHGEINHPSNGMLLEINAHNAFDRFYWCLKKTEEKHVYDLKVLKKRGLLRMPENNRVTFVDHSNDFPSAGSNCKRNRPVDLPNPHYLAIHAAIAEILHASGAGRFFDELLAEYQDSEGNPVVRSWPELETLMGTDLLRESVIQMLQSVKVD